MDPLLHFKTYRLVGQPERGEHSAGILCDFGGRECRRRYQRRCAFEARKFDSRDDADRCLAQFPAQNSFFDRVTHGRLQHVPGFGDLAADVDPRRVDRVDDRREAEAKISRRRLQRRQRFSIVGPSFRDQRLDRKFRLFDRLRLAIGDAAAEISRQRGDV